MTSLQSITLLLLLGAPSAAAAQGASIAPHAVVIDDSTTGSAALWITAYPRRFTLPPLARQTVRLLAHRPQEITGGEYWARLAITTRAASAPALVSDTSAIQVGLTLEVRTLLPIYHRKGTMSTSLSFDGATAARLADSVAYRLPIRASSSAWRSRPLRSHSRSPSPPTALSPTACGFECARWQDRITETEATAVPPLAVTRRRARCRGVHHPGVRQSR